MQHLLGSDWRDVFDIIITKAGKPNFFKETSRYRKIMKKQPLLIFVLCMIIYLELVL